MKPVLAIVSIIIVAIIFSCDDIFLRDIREDLVTVLSPSEDYTTPETSEILFWWKAVDGADGYNLQIASPDFENITSLKLDVDLDTFKYTISLPEGSYQWRILAFNTSYSTEYITRNIKVITEE